MVEDSRKLQLRPIAAGLIGSLVESYDFILYAIFAPIIGQTFFPPTDPLSATLAAFAVFAVAFVVRPIGAVVFGHIGDRLGRRQALSIAILLTSGATLLIGLLPGYAAIGIWAPLSLLVLRSLQGFAFAGEFVGAIAYVVEYSPKSRAGLAGGSVLAVVIAATLIATGVALLLQTWLGQAAVNAWGWRLGFVVAGPIGIVGFYLRIRLDETPEFRSVLERKAIARAPVMDVLRHEGLSIFLLCALITVQTVSTYYLVAFSITYLTQVMNVSREIALSTNLIALIVFAATCPLWGAISDRTGRKFVAIIGLSTFVLGTIPSFLLMQQGSWYSITLGQCIMGAGLGALAAATSILFLELFPVNLRYSGGSLGYNIPQVIFGGTAPFVATLLIKSTGVILAPAMYLTILAIVSLVITAILLRETKVRAARLTFEEDTVASSKLSAGI